MASLLSLTSEARTNLARNVQKIVFNKTHENKERKNCNLI